MKRTAMILSIGTSVPPRSLLQTDMRDAVLSGIPDHDERLRKFVSNIYDRSGIENRHTVIEDFHDAEKEKPFIPAIPSEDYGPSTGYRNGIFVREAPGLAYRSARSAFEKIGSIKPSDITHLVSASCTGFFAPGFDFELVGRLGLRENVSRYHLGFMGCFAALPALALARSICIADPDARVLVTTVEICSIHYRHAFDPDSIVSNSLFADGSASALVCSNAFDPTMRGIALSSFSSRIIPGSTDDMTWKIGEHGFEMTLSKSVPSRIEKNIVRLLDDTCEKAGIKKTDVGLYAIHPGGRAILDRACDALSVEQSEIDASYSVLRDYGNMSSATLLFVLDKLMRKGARGRMFLAAFGPGLTSETAIFEAS